MCDIRWLGRLLVGSLALIGTLTSTARAQDVQMIPPINGLTGSIGLQWNVDRFYTVLNKGIEETGEGIRHLTPGTHGPDRGIPTLENLHPGMPVVVLYTVKGISAAAPNQVNEGTVANVDRSRKRITVRFTDGSTEALRVSQHDKHSEEHAQSHSRVLVTYADESGRRVTSYFKQDAR
jgi:hypothetical protein